MKSIICSLFVLFIFQLTAQNPYLIWQYSYGGNATNSPKIILKQEITNDLFLIGSSNSNASFDKTEDSRGGNDIWILKTTEEGIIIWDKTIGGSTNDNASSALILGGYIYILASSDSPISDDKTTENQGLQDYWLVCLDFDGNIIWDKTYGGSNFDNASEIIELNNGNLLLVGSSMSGISGNKNTLSQGDWDYWILEVSPIDGNIIEQKSLGTYAFDVLFDAIQDAFGNVYLTGTSLSGIDGDKTDPGYGSHDFWMVKLDEDFNVLANKCFGGSALEYPRGEVLIKNGFLYLFTDSESPISGNKTAPLYGYFDYWLLKIDLDLNLIWDKSFGGNFWDRATGMIDQPADKFVLVGLSESIISGNKTAERYGSSSDIWMIIVDKDGNEVRQESYGGLLDDYGRNLVGDEQGFLYVLGGSESDIGGVKTVDNKGLYDYWLLKLDATDFLSVDKIEVENGITVYPNPYTNTVNFVVGAHSEPLLLSLYSLDGKIVFQTLIPTEMNHFVWDADTEMNQILIFEIRSNEELVTGKLVRGY